MILELLLVAWAQSHRLQPVARFGPSTLASMPLIITAL